MDLTPTQRKKFRGHFTSYCLLAEQWQVYWHYSRQRPEFGYGRKPGHKVYFVADCSMYLSLCYYWAMTHTGVWIADPLGDGNYNGYGNTGSEYEWSLAHATHAPTNKYLVGDWVIYGWSHDTVHTSVCRKAGTENTAIWSSNGNERAPQETKLHYHPDPVLGVWRHPALA
jgi:hypothetical protein